VQKGSYVKAEGLENDVEKFVQSVGGEAIPESNETPCADFLFREQNIVAELKTLEKEARQEHDRKLQARVNDWMQRRVLVVYGRPTIELQNVPPICQREWLSILQRPVEKIIRDANKQIRSTKKSLQLASAKGLLLIANQGNLLYTTPADSYCTYNWLHDFLVGFALLRGHQGGEEVGALFWASIYLTRPLF